ncbi:MAG: MCE family protein [Actinomycetota bacterium]|nr:MCE family protein [Actinomycetota bacterium]
MSVKNFRERSPILIGILSIIGITIGMVFAFSIDKLPFVKQAYELTADFENAAGLNPENQVRVAGIKVGTISNVELVSDRVRVTMEIDNGIEIPDDAFAEIKLATILGTKFVDIEGRGGQPFMEDGDRIPLERTAIPYEIYQASNEGTGVLEELDGPALNDMLRELATLVEVTEDELGVALKGLNDLGTSLNAKQDDLTSLLAQSNELTGFLRDEGDELVRLIDASNVVLETVVDQQEEIDSLLESAQFMSDQLVRVLRTNRGNADIILRRLERALSVLERNVKHLDMAFEYSGPSSRYFGKVFSQGRWGDIYDCAIILVESCEQDE